MSSPGSRNEPEEYSEASAGACIHDYAQLQHAVVWARKTPTNPSSGNLQPRALVTESVDVAVIRDINRRFVHDLSLERERLVGFAVLAGIPPVRLPHGGLDLQGQFAWRLGAANHVTPHHLPRKQCASRREDSGLLRMAASAHLHPEV